MHIITIVCFIFFLIPRYANAQSKDKALGTGTEARHKDIMFFDADKANSINLPFGYSGILTQVNLDAILMMIQDEGKVEEINALKFEKELRKKFITLEEAYDVFLPFSKNVNEKYDRIKISTHFLKVGTYSLYFMAVYNTVRYATPFIEKIYLISTKDSRIIDMKRIFLHHEGEMGHADYTLFNIDKNYIISLRDYEFNEDPFRLKSLYKYQILPSGKFSRYYDQDGFYRDDEEQGQVKNHHKEGKWIESKINGYVESQQYPTFTDCYTYLEASYKNGIPVGKWKFYKLLQKFNEETGAPILNTRKKGQLMYTEIYKNGILEKRYIGADAKAALAAKEK